MSEKPDKKPLVFTPTKKEAERSAAVSKAKDAKAFKDHKELHTKERTHKAVFGHYKNMKGRTYTIEDLENNNNAPTKLLFTDTIISAQVDITLHLLKDLKVAITYQKECVDLHNDFRLKTFKGFIHFGTDFNKYQNKLKNNVIQEVFSIDKFLAYINSNKHKDLHFEGAFKTLCWYLDTARCDYNQYNQSLIYYSIDRLQQGFIEPPTYEGFTVYANKTKANNILY